MRGFLVDTNVLSEFSRRGAPDQRVKSWLGTAALVLFGLQSLEVRFQAEHCDPYNNPEKQFWFKALAGAMLSAAPDQRSMGNSWRTRASLGWVPYSQISKAS